MTLLRAGLVLLLLGGVAPAAVVVLVHPAQAQDGGGDSDGGDDSDGGADSDGGDDNEPTEEEVRARQAAPATAPAVNFNALTVGDPNPALTSHGTSRGPSR